MKNLFKALIISALALTISNSANAAVISFEGLTNEDDAILTSTQGFTFDNFWLVNTTNVLFPNHGNGTNTPDYSVYNFNGNDASIESASNFNFLGAYFGSSQLNNNLLTVNAYRNGSLVASAEEILSNTTGSFINFNFNNIDKLEFSSSQLWFAMDDFTYTATPVPEPTTLAFGVAGLAGLLGIRRRK